MFTPPTPTNSMTTLLPQQSPCIKRRHHLHNLRALPRQVGATMYVAVLALPHPTPNYESILNNFLNFTPKLLQNQCENQKKQTKICCRLYVGQLWQIGQDAHIGTKEIHNVNKARRNAYSLSLFGCTLVISSTGIALIGSNSYEQSE